MLKTKHIKSHLFLLIALSASMLSCESEDTKVSQPVRSTELPSQDYAELAQANVKGLNFITNYVKEQNDALGNGRAAGIASGELLVSATEGFLQEEGYGKEAVDAALDMVVQVTRPGLENYYEGKAGISEDQASFIAALQLVFEEEYDYATTLSLIQTLEVQALNILPDHELGLILSSTAVAKAQVTYWYEHIGEVEMVSSNGRVQCVSSWRDVGRNAVGGGLAAGLGCAVVGVFSGPFSPATYGACVLGGGIAAGFQEIFMQCTELKTTNDNCLKHTGRSLPRSCQNYINYSLFSLGRNPFGLIGQSHRPFKQKSNLEMLLK